jgi:hypothetical protein
MTSTYTVERSRTIQASPDAIRPLLTNFRNWRHWSPWEEVDKNLHRAYSGPHAGIGAHYAWNGNRKAGAGSMEIVGLDETEVDIRLQFLKPFKSTNTTKFLMRPVGEGATEVTWRMVGPRPLVMRVLGPLMNPDKLVGGDFEKGLARLDEAVRRGHGESGESGSATDGVPDGGAGDEKDES